MLNHEQVWHEAETVDLTQPEAVECLAATLAKYNRGTAWLSDFLDRYRSNEITDKELYYELVCPKELDDSDWENAFSACSGQSRGYTEWAEVPTVCKGANCSARPFSQSDVREVIAYEDGENDGASWVAILHLWDGRYAFLEAGCDYTGWD